MSGASVLMGTRGRFVLIRLNHNFWDDFEEMGIVKRQNFQFLKDFEVKFDERQGYL